MKELVFVSGKGGTGKSTIATVLAKDLSSRGRRVLLVELEKKSSVQALLQLSSSPSYQPTASGVGFDWCLLQGMDCLVEYISSLTRLEMMTQKIFESTLLKTLVNVAPGLNDLSLLGKLTSHARKHGPSFAYDHVIVDAPSTGSFYSLIKAPLTLGRSVSKGPLHSQSVSIDQVLKNPTYTQYLFVSLFEELPMDELEDTLAQFHDDFADQISVVMNKALPLEKTNATLPEWVSFVENKIVEKNTQTKRVKELWSPCFTLDLFTEKFKDFLHDSAKGAVRPI